MGELNAKDFLILADQTPGEVTFSNFEELKSYLKRGLSVYETTIYTADNLDEAINDRNQLKAIKKKLTDKKKEIEKAYTMPYEDVKHMLDELIDMVKEPLNRADEIIKDCERQKKKNDIIYYAKKEVAVLGEDAVSVLKSEAFYNSRWLNVSYKMRDIEREISEKVTRIKNDLDLIKSMGGDNTPVLLARYFETLSTAGMGRFLQSVKKEEEKVLTECFETKNEPPLPCPKVLPTRRELECEKDVIITKTFRFTGSERNIAKAILQVKMAGIVVEEVTPDSYLMETYESDLDFDNPIQELFKELLDDNLEKRVKVGDTVKICDTNTGLIETYTIKETYYETKPVGVSHGYSRDLIYSTEEKSDNDIFKNEIRSESPLARVLLDKVVGYIFLWDDENGNQVEYKIVDIIQRA